MTILKEAERSPLDSLMSLVLNTDYRPVQVIDWRPAIEDIVSGSAYAIVDHDGHYARSERVNIPIPSVLVRRRRMDLYRPAAFTRRNALLAYWQPDLDGHGRHWTCGLCGKPIGISDLTFDHVVPRCRGGKTTWENIVFADSACNNRKGHQTLTQAGMRLHVALLRPTDAEIGLARVRARLASSAEAPEAWNDFLGDGVWSGRRGYWSAALDE